MSLSCFDKIQSLSHSFLCLKSKFFSLRDKVLHNLTMAYLFSILSLLPHPWEKAMAPHSSTVAQKIPQMKEPGRLQSMGSHRVGHDWATSLSLFTFMHWRRRWHPTPVFLPGESHGRRSLVGCNPWGRTELDTTEATWQQQQLSCYIWAI